MKACYKKKKKTAKIRKMMHDKVIKGETGISCSG